MTDEQCIAALKNLDGRNQETAHREADDLLCRFLADNGHQDVADAFLSERDSIGFWYD